LLATGYGLMQSVSHRGVGLSVSVQSPTFCRNEKGTV
jgi:hypothetical protein